MARKTTERAKPSVAQPQIDIEKIMAANGEYLKAVMQANEAVVEGMAAIGREIMEFGSARLRDDLEASGSLMRCHGPEEAFQAQCDYAQKATQQYLEEANRLVSLTTKIAGDCWAPLQERTRKTLHDMNGG